MIRKSIFILIIYLIIIQNCFANQENIIDTERQNCLDTNFQSDYSMAQCNYKAIEKYNNEIQELLKKLKNSLTKSQYYKLKKSQNQWDKYTEKNNALFESTLENKSYFEPYLLSSGIKFESYKQRYNELFIIYEYVEIKK